MSGRGECGEVSEEGEVVLQGFSEADARIEADAGGMDAEDGEGCEAFEEKGADFCGGIGVGGVVLHVSRSALHVHDDKAAAGAGAKSGHLGIGGEAGDVVDNIGTSGEGFAGDGCFCCIDGDETVPLGTDCADDGRGAGNFLFGADGESTGSAGFSSDIDDGGAVGDHFSSVREGGWVGVEDPAIGEGVWGGI